MFTVGAHELKDHLTSLIPCSKLLIVYENEIMPELGEIWSKETLIKEKINPTYIAWKRTDKFLVTLLLASIFECMFIYVSKCQCSTEIWHTLENEFFDSF